jgi:ring-1,2-phenylacetyl-CoA epoxidase subunit PaaD
MVKKTYTEQEIWELLEQVKDPEIPVLSVVDLGIVRAIEYIDDAWEITITPTYSGCPAMRTIEKEIEALLLEYQVPINGIKTVLSPAWTTDWITEKGRANLKAYGIAPPENEVDKSVLFSAPVVVTCPKCGSQNTKMVSEFGSTACKAHYQCNDCFEPFDYFKCLK